MRRTEKNGTVNSVRRTYKLCCNANTLNCGHAVFACHESTLAVHSENPFMVSNLTTGNSGQLKMSPKFRPSQKRRFWIWPIIVPHIKVRLGHSANKGCSHNSLKFQGLIFCIETKSWYSKYDSSKAVNFIKLTNRNKIVRPIKWFTAAQWKKKCTAKNTITKMRENSWSWNYGVNCIMPLQLVHQ